MSEHKHSLRSIVRKILAAFLLGSAAIILAVLIARFSFHELGGTVTDLSTPNEKLSLLNSLFEKITTLDQVQRAQAIENPNRPFSTFIDQSVDISAMIDSLKSFPWDNPQLSKLDSMKGILEERNRLFFSYLKVKAELMENREFSVQLDTLALILAADEITFDSTLLTSQKKTTTTIVKDSTKKANNERQKNFLKRIFSKKKATPVDTPKIKVLEETAYVVDTVALAKQVAALQQIEQIMKDMDEDQRNQRRRLQRRELELINTNSQLINQLLNILHTVEREELASMRKMNERAVSVMSKSMSRINLLVLTFFLAAALLIYLIWIDVGRSNYYKTQLEKARDKAEELSQVKQRFLANMSHEIRTPLQSIIGFAEQLKRKSEKNDEDVEAIYSSSEHLLQIVNEVLDFSKLTSGNYTFVKDPFKLLQLVKEVESSMRVQSERKNLTFVLDTEKANEFLLLGDPFRLRQILYNLLGNAIKFTHKGYVKLSVRTNPIEGRIRCVFEVIDSGIGMESSDLKKVFNQFEQASNAIATTYGGTGLGLTIVKSLVEAQGGNIEAASQPGIGSAFTVTLTYDLATQPLKVAKHQPNNESGAVKGKVMVIDDDTLILRLCSTILKRNNIDFITYNNGKTLLRQDADPEVAYILMDIRMPDINGVDLCRSLRKKYQPATRFIALTAHVLPEEKNSLLQAGFDNILTKPFHESELLNTLGVDVQVEDVQIEQPDFTLLRKMTAGDDDLFHSIVNQFMEETNDDVDKMQVAADHGKSSELREVVHKMAGRFAQMGMRETATKLQDIERKLVKGKKAEDLTTEVQFLSLNIRGTIKRMEQVI